MEYRLVCFDLDGTLVDEVAYIWTLLQKARPLSGNGRSTT
jgi:phosphoglycolate phosphatase-like HAD superfamily hydrolase